MPHVIGRTHVLICFVAFFSLFFMLPFWFVFVVFVLFVVSLFCFCCCVGLLVVEKLFVNQMISMIMHFTLHCSTLAGWAYWLNSFMNNK